MLHLIKLAVGIDDTAQLCAVQARRLDAAPGGPGTIPLLTRNTPRRAAELLDGGSLYWVVRGSILCRQRLLAIEEARDGEGQPCCRLRLDPNLIEVVPRSHRPFQGWRYLDPAAAPADRIAGQPNADAASAELAAELRALGLL